MTTLRNGEKERRWTFAADQSESVPSESRLVPDQLAETAQSN